MNGSLRLDQAAEVRLIRGQLMAGAIDCDEALGRLMSLRGRPERYPAWLGIGLDEATAIVVHDEVAEVVGRSHAFFFAAAAQPNGEIVVTELAEGDRYDLTRRVPVHPPEQSSADSVCLPEAGAVVE